MRGEGVISNILLGFSPNFTTEGQICFQKAWLLSIFFKVPPKSPEAVCLANSNTGTLRVVTRLSISDLMGVAFDFWELL